MKIKKIIRSNEYFDGKQIDKSWPHKFVVGYLLLKNIKNRIKESKKLAGKLVNPSRVV